jgi:hypothetical protein
MRKIFIAALAFAGVAVLAQTASAKSSCEVQRDICYAKIGRTVGKAAANRCDAKYIHCEDDLSAEPGNSIVFAVPGLGIPMMGPNPTVPVAANPVSPSSSSAQIATTRAANARKIIAKTKK